MSSLCGRIRDFLWRGMGCKAHVDHIGRDSICVDARSCRCDLAAVGALMPNDVSLQIYRSLL